MKFELWYAIAKTGALARMTTFLTAPNLSKSESVADHLFAEKLYEAARIIYEFVKHYAKLALCHIHLG